MKLFSRHRVSVHGHRGSRGTTVENTMKAFEEAAQCGADYFELDVQMSADDIPIVYHDPNLTNRLCTDSQGNKTSGTFPIRSLKTEEIKRYYVGGAPIPTLEDVLRWMKHNEIHLNLEIKIEGGDPKWIPDPALFGQIVLDLTRNYDLVSRTLFQSFDPRPLSEIRKREDGALISHLFDEKKDFLSQGAKVGANLIGPHHSLLNEELMGECRKRGIGVLPWTVNDEKDWERCLGLGVSGIITDFPRKCISYLGSRTA